MDDLKTSILYKLSNMFKKEHVLLTNRCNDSINLALYLCSTLEKRKVLIQDQGGWLTYKEYPKRYDMKIVELKTDGGLVDIADLDDHKDSVLLLNSMAGYIAMHDMHEVYEACKKNNIILINDACGSIGTDEAGFGDIIVCSFGKWKPINIGFGGCIATSNEDYYKFFLQKNDFEPKDEQQFLLDLDEKLEGLPDRLTFLCDKRNDVMDELVEYDILHPNSLGINVVVKFSDEEQRERLISYCKDNKLEYTICPRYIRAMVDGVSIEVKRLDYEELYDDSKFVEEDD